MSELEVVQRGERPITRARLVDDLRALGVRAGEVLLLHAGLSRLGWVLGAERTLLEAVLEVLGAEGTLVSPCFSPDLSDPRYWENPPVPESWWETIRAEMPAFDPVRTSTRTLGRTAEAFRSWPGVVRGDHPMSSFAALGPRAEELVGDPPLSVPFGDAGPLGRLARAGARSLLAGSGYDACTTFHLGESRLEGYPTLREGVPRLVDGERRWVEFESLDYSSAGFADLGAAYEATGEVLVGPLGQGEGRILTISRAADFALSWLEPRWRELRGGSRLGGEEGGP
jgi:aminoglycoside 3-N-acetyltransferase